MSDFKVDYGPQTGLNRANSANKSVVLTPATIPGISRAPMTPDEFVRREKRKHSGLIEKLYNGIKNVTGLGVGSKKVNKALNQAKNGQISQQELTETINKYRQSQETSAQLVGDTASVAAAGFTFFGLNKAFKYAKAFFGVNKPLTDSIDKVVAEGRKAMETDTKMSAEKKTYAKRIFNLYETTLKTINSNKKMAVVATVLAGLAGGITKYWTLKLNRIGSGEFKVDEEVFGKKKQRNNMQKAEAKAEKRRLNKQRRKANFKNFASGAINGFMMPVMTLGGIIGAPLYLVGNSLNRYFVANRTDKKKSLGGYFNNLANDAVTTAGVTAAIAVPLYKKGNFAKTFNENIAKVTKKLADATLKEANYGGVSAYKQLESTMLSSSSVKTIIDDPAISVEAKIQALTKENIFAAKFKQISNDGTELAKALKDKCPPTRTLEEAQKYIKNVYGDKYEVKKLMAVGTVAETYLAKSSDGKEVCIKILKDGISAEKITKDKEKFIEMVKNISDKSQDEKDYLIRNIEDLASGVAKEVNLKNEMEAAQKLAKSTNAAHVVKPIEVKDNVYVMEKAKGISLSAFMDLNRLYIEKEAAEKLMKDSPEESKKLIEKIDKEIESIKSRMPDFDDIKLRKRDTQFLLDEYQKVYIEQFHKIDKNGKIIHADIHPGNIFIDSEVLKSRKGKLFTLIDTGNMIDMGVEQSLHSLNLSNYIKQGNIEDIASYVLKDAKLPKNMTEQEAHDKVLAELRACFFDNETKLEELNDEKLLTLTDNIMKHLNIIPSSTQLNLNKSRNSAKNSLSDLQKAINAFDGIDIMSHDSTAGMVLSGGQKGIERLARNKMYDQMIKKQEKENLKQLSPAQKLKQKHNPNAPEQSGEDYITYKLKQMMMGDVKFD